MKTRTTELQGFLRTIELLNERIDRLEKSYANKGRLIEQSTQPALTIEQEFLFWRDTDDSKVYLIFRANGGDKKIELT